MESVFGFVTVLPGAFSAYRWSALQGEPLNAYFYVEEHSVKDMGPFLANMYLAEDRVRACFALCCASLFWLQLHRVTRTWHALLPVLMVTRPCALSLSPRKTATGRFITLLAASPRQTCPPSYWSC